VVARLADGRGWSAPSAIGTAGVAWGGMSRFVSFLYWSSLIALYLSILIVTVACVDLALIEPFGPFVKTAVRNDLLLDCYPFSVI